MRNGDVLHNPNLMSHEDIINFYDINDSQVNCDKFVRVEYRPQDDSNLPDIDKYGLVVDEDNAPDWFGEYKEKVEAKLKNIVKRRIINSDRKVLTGGLYVVKDCVIDKLICAQVIYLNGTVGEMCENSQVGEMRENSQVGKMWENSQVGEMRENSQVGVNNSKNKLPKK
jgi:hypothetical protein